MAITADDYNALTTALGGICFALTRRLPVAERQAICAARRFFSTWRRLWRRPWLAILSRKKKPSRAFVRARGRGKSERGETTTPGGRRWGCSAWTRSSGFFDWLGLALLRPLRLLGKEVGEALHGMDAGVFDGALRDLGHRRIGHA